MAIDTALLVADRSLQQYLVDKTTGTPLTNGTITLYVDDANRQTLKNWYYQSGAFAPYTFVPLSNPLRLSSYGTIQDPDGNDVIPFYYPYDEDNPTDTQTYYITVDDVNGLRQFTRANFPYTPVRAQSDFNPTHENLLVNGEFINNVGTISVNNILNTIIAGSQHDHYDTRNNAGTDTITGTDLKQEVMKLGTSDIRWLKDIKGDTETVSFGAMDKTILKSGDLINIVPEYYLRVENSAGTAAGFKCVQYPLSMHLKSIQKTQNFLFAVWCRSTGATNTVQFRLYAYTGTNAASDSQEHQIGDETYTITSSDDFQLFSISDQFPDVSALTTSTAGDDAWFIRIYFPTTGAFTIDHCKPQVYFSDSLPSNSFQTYDKINSLVSAPRTGDIRLTSNNYFYFINATKYDLFGWVPMDNGTIGNGSSGATTRANIDTWQLFNFLWHECRYQPGYAPMYTSSGAQTGYGQSAYADFNANNRLSLLRTLGHVIAGIVQHIQTAETFTADNSSNELTVADNTVYGENTPVMLFETNGSLPSGLNESQIYYTYIPPNDTTGTKLMLTTDVNTETFPTLASLLTKPSDYRRRPTCKYATTGALTATYSNGAGGNGVGATLTNAAAMAAFQPDGPTVDVGDLVLVKDQASSKQNGVYTVTTVGDVSTNWVLTRAVWFDEPTEVLVNDYVYVSAGATNSDTLWSQTQDVIKIEDTANGNDIDFSSLSFDFAEFSDNGSGNNYIQIHIKHLGANPGTDEYQIVPPNLPDPIFGGEEVVAGSGGNSSIANVGSPTVDTAYRNTVGNNLTQMYQPTTYYNIFMKL